MPVSEGFLSMISWIPLTKMAPLLSKDFDMFRLKNVQKNTKKCIPLLHIRKKSSNFVPDL